MNLILLDYWKVYFTVKRKADSINKDDWRNVILTFVQIMYETCAICYASPRYEHLEYSKGKRTTNNDLFFIKTFYY